VEQLKQAVRNDTMLISIMTADNVVGTILPIKELCDAVHEKGIIFHTYAVQAVSHIPINVRNLGVDLLYPAYKCLGRLRRAKHAGRGSVREWQTAIAGREGGRMIGAAGAAALLLFALGIEAE
jgi:hypothetical protein